MTKMDLVIPIHPKIKNHVPLPKNHILKTRLNEMYTDFHLICDSSGGLITKEKMELMSLTDYFRICAHNYITITYEKSKNIHN